MKINELEKALGIPRASVRYYEKEGLMSPHRHDNGYRDYDDNDVKTLKTIIVLRKMGLSVDQIKQVLSGRVGLNAAVEKNTAFLQDQIESLNGAIRMCNEVLKSDMSIDSFDTETYWRRLTEGEKNGEAFASIANDLVDFESRIIRSVQSSLRRKISSFSRRAADEYNSDNNRRGAANDSARKHKEERALCLRYHYYGIICGADSSLCMDIRPCCRSFHYADLRGVSRSRYSRR